MRLLELPINFGAASIAGHDRREVPHLDAREPRLGQRAGRWTARPHPKAGRVEPRIELRDGSAEISGLNGERCTRRFPKACVFTYIGCVGVVPKEMFFCGRRLFGGLRRLGP